MEEFPKLKEGVIIAMKGLPCTGKSEIARMIGEWARCPVLYTDDFLDTVSLEKGYTSKSMPSKEEAEGLYRHAFDGLCKSAHRHLHWMKRCVVIKSRLCSTFELDRLLRLSRETRFGVASIIIIECCIKNENRLCARLEYKAMYIPRHEEWYKPRSRLDFEKAKDDWLNAQANWELHLCHLINAHGSRPTRVIRLALDPFDDLNFDVYSSYGLTPDFRDAFRYLLTMYGAREGNWIGEEIIRDRYEVVQLDKVRRYLVEKELLRASTTTRKSIHLCATTRGGKCCVFKTCTDEELHYHHYDCGVCGERVDSEGYACHFCILALHKSCAELQGFNFLAFASNPLRNFNPRREYRNLPRTHACKACTERGKDFSDGCRSCLFETHLKCRMFPTIINHECHHHALSLQVGDQFLQSDCKACAYGKYSGKYGCYVCGLYYCLKCVSRPLKVKHKHGGHEHAMKLVYSRHGMDEEEDYWCDFCYKYMDPQYWFYSCQDCPYYEAHARCIEHTDKTLLTWA